MPADAPMAARRLVDGMQPLAPAPQATINEALCGVGLAAELAPHIGALPGTPNTVSLLDVDGPVPAASVRFGYVWRLAWADNIGKLFITNPTESLVAAWDSANETLTRIVGNGSSADVPPIVGALANEQAFRWVTLVAYNSPSQELLVSAGLSPRVVSINVNSGLVTGIAAGTPTRDGHRPLYDGDNANDGFVEALDLAFYVNSAGVGILYVLESSRLLAIVNGLVSVAAGGPFVWHGSVLEDSPCSNPVNGPRLQLFQSYGNYGLTRYKFGIRPSDGAITFVNETTVLVLAPPESDPSQMPWLSQATCLLRPGDLQPAGNQVMAVTWGGNASSAASQQLMLLDAYKWQVLAYSSSSGSWAAIAGQGAPEGLYMTQPMDLSVQYGKGLFISDFNNFNVIRRVQCVDPLLASPTPTATATTSPSPSAADSSAPMQRVALSLLSPAPGTVHYLGSEQQLLPILFRASFFDSSMRVQAYIEDDSCSGYVLFSSQPFSIEGFESWFYLSLPANFSAGSYRLRVAALLGGTGAGAKSESIRIIIAAADGVYTNGTDISTPTVSPSPSPSPSASVTVSVTTSPSATVSPSASPSASTSPSASASASPYAFGQSSGLCNASLSNGESYGCAFG